MAWRCDRAGPRASPIRGACDAGALRGHVAERVGVLTSSARSSAMVWNTPMQLYPVFAEAIISLALTLSANSSISERGTCGAETGGGRPACYGETSRWCCPRVCRDTHIAAHAWKAAAGT